MFHVPFTTITRNWRLFHAPAYTSPLVCTCPIVLTVHDISYLVKDEWYPDRTGTLRRAYYLACMRRADRIITPSRFSTREVVRMFGELETKLRCVPQAVSDSFYPDQSAAEMAREKFGLPSRFMLHVGDIHPRRNIEMLNEVALDTGLKLVLVGRELVPVPLKSRVIRLESISVDELRGCYSAAAVFVYPSVYEGFGLPLLEAMACGLPVVASNRASIPEVCGDSAILVEPDNQALCQGIEEALSKRARLIEQGLNRASTFSWKETARKTCGVYEELIGPV